MNPFVGKGSNSFPAVDQNNPPSFRTISTGGVDDHKSIATTAANLNSVVKREHRRFRCRCRTWRNCPLSQSPGAPEGTLSRLRSRRRNKRNLPPDATNGSRTWAAGNRSGKLRKVYLTDQRGAGGLCTRPQHRVCVYYCSNSDCPDLLVDALVGVGKLQQFDPF